MTKEEYVRFFLHLPVGIFNGIIYWMDAAYGIGFTIAFLTYEAMNDWRKFDSSYKDILGFVSGLALPMIYRLLM